jgi:fructose-specific phosphotransferase system component IIB
VSELSDTTAPSAPLTTRGLPAKKQGLSGSDQKLTTQERRRAVGGISERGKEIKRRRQRRKKLAVINRKLQKATASEKMVIAEKIRNMTPGAEVIIKNLSLSGSDR